MHYDAAASKAMGVFPSPTRFQLASALGHDESGGLDFSLFSILNKTCTKMGARLLRGCVLVPCRVNGSVSASIATACCQTAEQRVQLRETLVYAVPHPMTRIVRALNTPFWPTTSQMAAAPPCGCGRDQTSAIHDWDDLLGNCIDRHFAEGQRNVTWSAR